MIPTNLVLWSCLAGASAVLADRNITVDDFDSRILYTGPWRHENSGATFDRFNRTTSYTFQAAASASLKFNGTAVYFIGYGVPPPEKDTYQVTLDGQNEVHSLRVGVNDTRAKFMGYWRSGLDALKEHTIIITNLQGTFSNIDAFIVTVPDNSTMKDGFATEALTSDEQPGGQSGLSTNVTVGIVVAVVGISVGLLGALGIYLWRRRNNRAGTLRRSKNVEGGTAFFQSAGAQNATLARVSPFEWASSARPTQHEGVRKDQRPNGATNGAPATRSEPDSPPPYTR